VSCRRYRDSVVLFADGELTGDAAGDVRLHVAGCEACAATLGELEKLSKLLTPADAGQDPTMAETRFWRSFEADLALRVHAQATPFWRRAIVLPVPAAVCMGVAVVALGGMVLQQRGQVAQVRGELRQLEAKIETEQADVVFASSERLDEQIALMNARKKARASEVKRLAPPRASFPTAESPFRIPAPNATPSDIPANIRFVDTASADFY
jgi:hypothetical protein